MATPVASFSVRANLLVVSFMDTSTNTPTSWSWEFGDSQTSTSQNPSHTYSAPGTYVVKLTATNADGSSSLQREIIARVDVGLPVSLRELVKAKARNSTYTEELLDVLIAQWQLFIGPLVTPAVGGADILNEGSYSPLANVLIGDLVAYDLIFTTMMGAMVGSSAQSTSTQTTTVTAGGGLKALETGPAKAEWYDASEKLVNFFKTASSGAFQAGSSPLDILQKEICTIAASLGVQLPMCPVIKSPVIIPRMARTAATTNSNQVNSALYLMEQYF